MRTFEELRADLHIHTDCSDGSLNCQQVCELARQEGLQAISITDHDTIAAYDTLFDPNINFGLKILPGVEFSAQSLNHSVHVLAYGFYPKNDTIRQLCKKHAERRTDRNERILAKLKKLGILITQEDLGLHPYSIGRPHIAQALVHKGHVNSMQEAFQSYLGEGKPAFDLGEAFSVEETIEWIQQAGAKAVIAHPHLVYEERLIQSLLHMPFDGIEVFYGRYLQEQNERWMKIADKKGWFMTGGSDFHGPQKHNSYLGSSFAPVETTLMLLNHAEQERIRYEEFLSAAI